LKNRPIRVLHSAELAGIFKGLGEGWKTAKPLCVGSIPTRASKSPQKFQSIVSLAKAPSQAEDVPFSHSIVASSFALFSICEYALAD
jgi:hypothetical protein